MFNKILIANRGEIAGRIARTARRMGIATVAVYSHADRDALHVRECDAGVAIGGDAPRKSYLCARKIIDAARNSGAEAVHPGYGFLSENPGFAEACARAGLIFIGPPPKVIRDLGDKRRAREIMARAGVPVLPGADFASQSARALRAAAEEVGYPLMLKAAAGGGGVGMRVVMRAEDFDAALAAVRREAKSAFADANVYMEKYLPRARHVEVQIFADAHGNAVHLYDRDCSLQRRRQKIIEEAPVPGIKDALRDEMTRAALNAVHAVGYVGAGTLEFLAQKSRFYFMEMNTRLQVEHAVTEMVTGLDLVEWQLRVAAGETLPCAQEEVRVSGHAIEARIYAENPAKHFLPAAGEIKIFREGTSHPWRRLDCGVARGDVVSTHYDPLLAKLIAHGGDRETARARLFDALGEMDIAGAQVNLDFLQRVIASKTFQSGDADVSFIERHREKFCNARAPSDECLAAVALHSLARIKHDSAENDPHSPWLASRPWQLNLPSCARINLTAANKTYTAQIIFERELAFAELDNARVAVALTPLPENDLRGNYLFHRDNRAQPIFIFAGGDDIYIRINSRRWTLSRQFTNAAENLQTASAKNFSGKKITLTAPMPAIVTAIHAAKGASVFVDAPLLTLEAMKMEHTLRAPCACKIIRVLTRAGEQVGDGETLMELESA